MRRHAALLVPLLLLCACSSPEPSADAGRKSGAFDRIAREATAEIREEMATENLDLGKGRNGEPRAALSPQGDLLIDGKPVPLDAAQRERVLAYRGELAGVAEAGAEVGLQAAQLATDALAESARNLMRGESPDVESRVKARSEEIEASARKLCERLPRLYAAQDALVAAVPAFEPYAEMDRQDIDDCLKDTGADA